MTTFKTLPDALNKPTDARPSRIRQFLIDPRATRRRVLKMFTGAGVAMGLGAIGSIPLSRPRPAYAAAYEEWLNSCQGYYAASTVCVPTSAYYGSDNCAPGSTWHREDRVRQDSCVEIRYTHDPTSCNGRNAWVWRGNGPSAKCSDGRRYVENSCGSDFSAFSICRTFLDDEPQETVTPVEGGTYRIENVNYGSFLEAADFNVTHSSGTGDATHWQATFTSGGYLQLRNVDEDRRLRFKSPTELEAQTWTGTGNRTQWSLAPGSTEGAFVLTNKRTETNLAARRGGVLISHDGDGNKAQWRFVAV